MKKLPFILYFILCGNLLHAQSSETIRKYIENYKEIAIQEMQRTGVPAAITLAQGIHETGAGQSELVRKSNNHFGIKCKSDWKGESVSHDDDARGECFRKYDDPLDSYRDHSDFLKNRPHYASLFKLDPTDYEGWCYGLKKAGYATNPKYPQILIKLIREYSLQDYTLVALERKPLENDIILVSNTAAQQLENSLGDDEIVQIPPLQYPSGIFKINETKVTWINKGTSYLKIAEEHDISLPRLFDFNDMRGLDIALTDQLLFLQRKRKKGANEYHVVVPGETLHDISQKEGIRFESLLGYNFLKPNMQPKAGEKLYLQEEAQEMPKLITDAEPAIAFNQNVDVQSANNVSSEEPAIFHTVQPKETMYAIAKKYDVGVEDVVKWNDLQTAHLKIGQQLRIYKKTVHANKAAR